MTLKNRIVMPPMVTFGYGIKDGVPTDQMVEHYAARAAGGVGLIIVEATSIHPTGLIADAQIGIRNDRQTEQHKRIVDAIHAFDVPVLLQINHAGVKSIDGNPKGPSDFSGFIQGKNYVAKGLSVDEIAAIRDDFVEGAGRAFKAGYDGVELHCAHSYLLCAFLSPTANKRNDLYGGDTDGRMRLPIEILGNIRKAERNKLISVRFGFDEPDIPTSALLAQGFEKAGADILHISTGFGSSGYMPEAGMKKSPVNFPFNIRLWGAKKIKEYVKCPIIGVGGIRQVQQAEKILADRAVDLVGVGRGLLCDPNWANKIRTGEEIFFCRNCPRCLWSADRSRCPGVKAQNARRATEGVRAEQ
jgi:2,4-dienoyl-CoA reductase-like NADH-dependent reductase (Old Yellow Enzyme family)